MDFGQVAGKVVAEKPAADGGDNNGYTNNPRHKFIKMKFPRIILAFVMFNVACIFVHVISDSFFSSFLVKPDPSSTLEKDHSLVKILSKASMEDSTVIITTLNEAWAAPNSVFDLFLESFRMGNETLKLLDHLVVIAMDEKAYNRCIATQLHCYYLTSNDTDFSAEAQFMTPDYLKMMWKRTDFLRTVLDLGYNFIFTDTDIMWFRNPLPRFYPDVDFQIANDFYNGNPSDINNLPNGGFIYVKSNNRTSMFYKFWYNSSLKYPGSGQQDILNKIKYDPYINKIGLTIKFLDTAFFGGFCQPSRDLDKVCTMHANCCVGLSNKIFDLKIVLGVWQNYMSVGKNNSKKSTESSPWIAPQYCKSP